MFSHGTAEWKPIIDDAIVLFNEERDTLFKIMAIQGGFSNFDPEIAKRLSDPNARKDIANVIRVARDINARAVNCLKLCSDNGGVDLYIPIMEQTDIDSTKTFLDVEPMWTATYKVTGKDAAEKGCKFFLTWAKNHGLFDDGKVHRFFAYYNHERMWQEDFFYKIHVTVDKDFVADDENIVLEQFNGGHYAIMKAKYTNNGVAWREFINSVSKSPKYCFGNWWFFEEYKIDKPSIEMDTKMVLYMPVKLKS